MSAEFVIRTQDLTKTFPGGVQAVTGLDLQVPRGAVYGLIGLGMLWFGHARYRRKEGINRPVPPAGRSWWWLWLLLGLPAVLVFLIFLMGTRACLVAQPPISDATLGVDSHPPTPTPTTEDGR
jgi:hypothetical protein